MSALGASFSTVLHDVLTGPAVRELGWAIVHSLWQIAALAAVSAGVLRALRGASASARYIIACFTLALMAAAPVGTFVCSTALVGRPPSKTTVIDPSILAAPDPPAAALLEVQQPAVQWWSARLARWSEPLLVPAVITWCGGTLLLSFWRTMGWLRLRRFTRNLHELSERPLRRMLDRQRKRLRVTALIQLCESALVEVPTLVGWLKPVILLPASALAGLTPQQLEGILAHELAHIRRHDCLVNIVAVAIETVLFYHPAVWWLSRRIRDERELCCDDLAADACRDRRGYAEALAAMEDLRAAQGARWAMAIRGRGGALLPRIRRLLATQAAAAKASQPRELLRIAIGCSWLVLPLLSLPATRAAAIATIAAPAAPAEFADHCPTSSPSTAAHAAQVDPMQALLDRTLPEIRFDNIAFLDAIDFLRDITSANISVNWRALEAAGIRKNTPVSVRLSDAKFSNVLDAILKDASGGKQRLTYRIDDGVITISTEKDHRAPPLPSSTSAPSPSSSPASAPSLVPAATQPRGRINPPAISPPEVAVLASNVGFDRHLVSDIASLDRQISSVGRRLGMNHPRMIEARVRRESLARQLQDVARQSLTRDSVVSSTIDQ